MKISENIFFTADIHGNQYQLDRALRYCLENNYDFLILGGDLSPKSQSKRSPSKQRDFFIKKFLPAIKRYRDFGLDAKIIALFGNDDFSDNFDEVKKLAEKYSVVIASNDIIPLNDDTCAVCYSYVPPTPFKYKDWEKPDFESDTSRICTYNGLILKEKSAIEIGASDFEIRGTISNDLNILFTNAKSKYKKTILISHAPPFQTNLDLTYNAGHVGSISIKKAILEFMPTMSLHGHIHESFEKSGMWYDKIGKSLAFNPSNKFNSKTLNYISIPLSKPKNAKYGALGDVPSTPSSYSNLAYQKRRLLNFLKTFQIVKAH